MLQGFEISTYFTWDLCHRHNPSADPLRCTYGQLRQLCAQMQMAMPGTAFRPEAITESGVEFADWPGRAANEYKTFRFLTATGVPWIGEGTPDGASFCLSNDQGRVSLKLKAFHGAPAFSDDELQHFRHIFEAVIQPGPEWEFLATPSAATVNHDANW
jgi:hypothetical protein